MGQTVRRCLTILLLATSLAAIRVVVWPDELWTGRHELLMKMHKSGVIEELPLSDMPDLRRKGSLLVDLRDGSDRLSDADTATWRGRSVVFLATEEQRRAVLIQIRTWRRTLDLKSAGLMIAAADR